MFLIVIEALSNRIHWLTLHSENPANKSKISKPWRSSSVAFNYVGATIVSWSDTLIVATVPSGAATGAVKVTVGSTAIHAHSR